MKMKNNLIAVVLLTLLTSSLSLGGTVTQVKNNKVMISLDEETVAVGDQLYVLNSDGKKIAIVEVTVSKNKKALATVVKGKPVVDGTTQIKESSGGESSESTKESSGRSAGKSKIIRQDMIQIGFLVKMMMNTMAAKQQDSTLPFPNKETVSMKGSSFGIAGTLDYKLMNWLKFHGAVSYDMLDVAGSGQYNSCDGKTSKDCNASISYLGFQGLGRFDIVKSDLNLWTGVGYSAKIPLSKKSTAINTEALKQSDSIVFALGADYHMNNKSFIPMTFEYHYSLNTSEEVPTIEQMAFMAGYGIKF